MDLKEPCGGKNLGETLYKERHGGLGRAGAGSASLHPTGLPRGPQNHRYHLYKKTLCSPRAKMRGGTQVAT